MTRNQNSQTLLDHLQAVGYEPGQADNPYGGQPYDIYDLIVSGTGSVRVVDMHEDGTDVYRFNRYLAEIWSAKFGGAPDAAIIATLEAAEWELADLRGGPVTPAQTHGIQKWFAAR